MAGRPFPGMSDDRAEPREEVLHRSRVVLADQRHFAVTVVNLSPGGMMVRGEVPAAAGEWITVTLPGRGDVRAAVRWSLGGRIGCQFERELAGADYYPLLAAMRG